MSAVNSNLYEDFLQQCKEVRPPPGWSRFSQGSGLYRAPDNFASLFKSLRKKFGSRAVRKSGLCVSDESGAIRENPVFAGIPTVVLPVRSEPSSAPFDLVTDLGAAKGTLPLRVIARDFAMHDAIEANPYLLASFGLRDLSALRAVGLPAAIANGLERLTADNIEGFRSVFGFSGPVPAVVPRQLYLVAWAPSRVSRERKNEVDEVIESLFANKSAIGLGLQNVFVWQPTSKEILSLKKCLAVGRRIDVVQLLEGSLANAQSLAPIAAADGSPLALLDFERRFRRALSRTESTLVERRRTSRAYQRAINEWVVTPLVAHAAKITDPVIRTRYVTLARLCEIAIPAATVQQARMEKALIDGGLGTDKAAFDFGEILKAFDALFKGCKAND